MNSPTQSPADSRLLRDLNSFLPAIRAKLDASSSWSGDRVIDRAADHAYERLACRDSLIASDTRVRYLVALHRFAAPGLRTAMHDHRYPIAVLPMACTGGDDALLYRMPWECRADGQVLQAGVLDVRAGIPYAIGAPDRIFHAVHSVAPHLSLVIADASSAPRREARLPSTALQEPAATALRQAATEALDRLLRVRARGLRNSMREDGVHACRRLER